MLFIFSELIPRPARACQDPPMYLRLRMGRQLGKSTPLPTTVMSYGKNKLRPEYWFSIPKNKYVLAILKTNDIFYLIIFIFIELMNSTVF